MAPVYTSNPALRATPARTRSRLACFGFGRMGLAPTSIHKLGMTYSPVVVQLGKAKPPGRAPTNSAVAGGRLCGGHRQFSGRIGLRHANATEEPPMTDDVRLIGAILLEQNDEWAV